MRSKLFPTRPTLFGAATVAALAGCGDPAPAPQATRAPAQATEAPAPEAPTTVDARSSAEAAALAAAEGAATELGRTLRARLLAAMAEGGPTRAAEVCATEAPGLATQVAERTGARVGRGSLRMRGASTPPPWVQDWLVAQGERSAEGVTGFARVEDGHARVLRPIAVEPACTACHGRELAPEIAAILDARYPDDRARGYAEGDLRGALWAEVDIP
jgi:hypothetical protein